MIDQNVQHKVTSVKDIWRCTCGVSGFPNSQEDRNLHLDGVIKNGGSLTKKLIYLASPHSHTNSAIREDRYLEALRCAKWLVNNGFWIYSPIVSSHNLFNATEFDNNSGGMGWEYWKDFDTEIITRCDELWVLEMKGTGDSKGVKAEIDIAKLQNKRVFHITRAAVAFHGQSDYLIVEECYQNTRCKD